MRAINQKLVRDISQMRGQVITIGLVVAAGVSLYVAMHTTYRSLQTSKVSYYEAYRFPDAFAHAKRVPKSVARELAGIEGVALAYTRIVEPITVPIEDRHAPATGLIVSLPTHGKPPLNDLFVVKGRLPDPRRSDEAVVLEAFATANKLLPGFELEVIINGKLRKILLTGIVMAPEYVFALGASTIAYDPGAFGIFWMPEASAAAAFDMKGAFNDVNFRLQSGASELAVLEAVDRVLKPYGGTRAYGRKKHVSNHFVVNELAQLKVQATIIPLIFLAVAAFLVNVVLGRVVQLQRGQIATLKALGYTNREVGLHYLMLVSLIVLLGAAAGVGVGSWMGAGLTEMYKPYFRFPVFEHRFEVDVVAIAVLISLTSALVGAWVTVRRIMALAPAEAMRPAAPPNYKISLIDRISRSFLGTLGRMVVRELRRRPLRLLISALGIAMAVGIMVIGRFMYDSVNALLDIQFGQAMREDITVIFRDPEPERSVRALSTLPGVLRAEAGMSAPFRFTSGTQARETAIITRQSYKAGMPESRTMDLRQFLDRDARPIRFPAGGIALTDILAERLGVKPGDTLQLEHLEGDRQEYSVEVVALVRDMFGIQGYMDIETLRVMLRTAPLATEARLQVTVDALDGVQSRLADMPSVAATSRPSDAVDLFNEQSGGSMAVMMFVLSLFAAIIAVGIVYNNARVSLSMRQRDLASMRVLGYTRAEISSVLLGELAAQVLLAIPFGIWFGITAAQGIMAIADPENFRIPSVISGQTVAFASMVTVGSALFSALLVRRKLDRLDLIGVLKTRD